MTTTLGLLIYAMFVFTAAAIAFGWSSGLELRYRDEREDRLAGWLRQAGIWSKHNAALLRHSIEHRG